MKLACMHAHMYICMSMYECIYIYLLTSIYLFYCWCVLVKSTMTTTLVCLIPLPQFMLGSFTHNCFCTISANINTVKKEKGK